MGDGGQGSRRARSSTSTRGSPGPRRSPTRTSRSARAATSSSSVRVINYILTNEKYFHEYVRRLHQRGDPGQRGLRRRRRPRRRVLRLRPRDRHATTPRAGPTTVWPSTPPDGRQRPGRLGRGRQRPRGESEESRVRPRRRPRARRPRRRPGARRIKRDETLQHPRTVFQILKRHYARYTPELVQEICGISAEQLLEVCEAVTATAAASGRPTWVYSVGWTHHTVGVQYIRGCGDHPAAAGQHGPAGRRHHGAARARQHPGLDRHPDPVQPAARLPADAQGRTARHASTTTSPRSPAPTRRGSGPNAKAYTVNLLKAWWGDAATAENDFAFDYLPRLTGDHGTYATVMSMLDDEIDGYFLLGQNPAVGSAHGKMQRLGLAHLKWLVVRDLNLIESATFWKDAPGDRDRRAADRPTSRPRCSSSRPPRTWRRTARSPRPSGCCSGTTRRSSRRGTRRASCSSSTCSGRSSASGWPGSTDERDRPLLDLTWDYPVDEHGEISRRGGAGARSTAST